MAYCRWSSDDYQCDVYVYESCDGGFPVHIAGSRYVFAEPLPEDIEYTKENFGAWYDRYRKVQEIVERSTLKPIGLPRDGETIWVADAAQAAETLKSLKDEGYRVPQYAIDALLEEAKEGENDGH